MQLQSGKKELPWALCLLFSVFTGIAAVGSIFEFIDRNPLFGVVQPDNPVWAPILLFFAVTGFPTAGACRTSHLSVCPPPPLPREPAHPRWPL